MITEALTAAPAKFCDGENIGNIPQLDIGRVRQFRASWKDSPISALKKLERTRSFFKFCVDSGWMKENPAKPLKSPIVTDPPTLPFPDDEVTRIVKHATGKWRARSCAPEFRPSHPRRHEAHARAGEGRSKEGKM